MSTITSEVCENCGRTIGKLETPHVWEEHIVCGQCLPLLRYPSPPSSSPSAPADTSQRDPVDAFTDSDRNAAAAAVLLRVGFWIASALVIGYLIFQILRYG